MKVKLKLNPDISSLELRELSAFDGLEKDTIYDVLLMEMYEGKVKFIIVYNKDDFDGICGFNAELFDIIDGSIPNRWNVVRIEDALSVAPKNINYENFWSDLQEIFEDDLNFREKEKRYCFAFRNYVVEFAGFIDFKICKSRNLQNQSYFSPLNKEAKYSSILTPSFFISFSLALTSASCQRSGGSVNITLSRLKFLTSSSQPSQR